MKIKWLVILLAAGNCTALGQAVFADMMCQLEEAYKNRNTYSYEVIYEYYEENGTTPSDVLEGVIYKKGDNYFSRIGPTDFVYLDGVLLKINHDEKAMLYSEYRSEIPVSPVQLSSMTDYFDDVKVTKKEGLVYCDVSFIPSSLVPYHRMLLVLSGDGTEIVRQELFFRSGGGMFPGGYGAGLSSAGSRVVVSFRSVSSGGMEKHLDLSHYIISSFPSLVPSSYYPGYRIYQQTP